MHELSNNVYSISIAPELQRRRRRTSPHCLDDRRVLSSSWLYPEWRWCVATRRGANVWYVKSQSTGRNTLQTIYTYIVLLLSQHTIIICIIRTDIVKNVREQCSRDVVKNRSASEDEKNSSKTKQTLHAAQTIDRRLPRVVLNDDDNYY